MVMDHAWIKTGALTAWANVETLLELERVLTLPIFKLAATI